LPPLVVDRGPDMHDVSDGASSQVIVYVVEDDALIQELVGPALEDAGFAVVMAATGDEALSMLEKDDAPLVRAVVTDIDLGTTVTGWGVARRARELHAEIPVIYMTGGSADDWSAHGVPNSVLVTKPFAPAQIVTAVSQLLNAVAATTSPVASDPSNI